MTGREFCELLAIDYDEILRLRTAHQQENLAFVAAKLLQIEALRPALTAALAEDCGDQRTALVKPPTGAQLGLFRAD